MNKILACICLAQPEKTSTKLPKIHTFPYCNSVWISYYSWPLKVEFHTFSCIQYCVWTLVTLVIMIPGFQVKKRNISYNVLHIKKRWFSWKKVWFVKYFNHFFFKVLDSQSFHKFIMVLHWHLFYTYTQKNWIDTCRDYNE